MPKYLVCFLLLLISLPSIALGAGGGYYFGGQLGMSLIDTVDAEGANGHFYLTPSSGLVGSVLVGYDYADSNPDFAQGRVELEMSWRQNPLDTVEFSGGALSAGGDLTVQSAMLNFFYEYHGLKPLLAYYGVGGGVARVTIDKATVSDFPIADDSDDVLAYQAGLGLGYQVTSKLTVDLGYRFFSTEDPEFKDVRGENFSVKYQSHAIQFGARYRF